MLRLSLPIIFFFFFICSSFYFAQTLSFPPKGPSGAEINMTLLVNCVFPSLVADMVMVGGQLCIRKTLFSHTKYLHVLTTSTYLHFHQPLDLVPYIPNKKLQSKGPGKQDRVCSTASNLDSRALCNVCKVVEINFDTWGWESNHWSFVWWMTALPPDNSCPTVQIYQKNKVLEDTEVLIASFHEEVKSS